MMSETPSGRKRKAPDRLDPTFEKSEFHAKPLDTSSRAEVLAETVEELERTYAFQPNALPCGDRDMNIDKVFYFAHATPFQLLVEESTSPWVADKARESNLAAYTHWRTTSILAGLFGPIEVVPSTTNNNTNNNSTKKNNKNNAMRRFYMMPMSPSDALEKWEMPPPSRVFLLGGKMPFKAHFELAYVKRKRTRLGFVFSHDRDSDSLVVCCIERNVIAAHRIPSQDVKDILPIEASDHEIIALMKRNLQDLGLLDF